MSQLIITIPDALDNRVADAFDKAYPGRPQGTSKAAWVKEKVKQYMKDVVVGQERIEAERVAGQTAQQTGDSQISFN